MTGRVLTFVTVGSIGLVVQIAVLILLTSGLGWPTALSTAIAVESAVLVNFFWHERLTWHDRPTDSRAWRLWRFHLANGLTSILGNVVVTSLGVRLGASPALANLGAVGALAILNFVMADRWVFAARGAAAAALLLSAPSHARAAEPGADTIAAWQGHIAQIERALPDPGWATALDAPDGRTIAVPGGTIHEWRGATLIHGTTVAALVRALTNPGLPPPQDDVLESCVKERHGLSLRVYLKLQRKAMVTATYDTEHDVTFTVQSPHSATSRSIATRIVELGHEDRGFLWRLNAYWRYTQVGSDVRADVVSVSLSRSVPRILSAVARPIVNRVARESMTRALEALRRFGESLPAGREARLNEQKGTASCGAPLLSHWPGSPSIHGALP
jgi:putative flippase GtrA